MPERNDKSDPHRVFSVIRPCARFSATAEYMTNATCGDMLNMQHTSLAPTAVKNLLEHASLLSLPRDKESNYVSTESGNIYFSRQF